MFVTYVAFSNLKITCIILRHFYVRTGHGASCWLRSANARTGTTLAQRKWKFSQTSPCIAIQKRSQADICTIGSRHTHTKKTAPSSPSPRGPFSFTLSFSSTLRSWMALHVRAPARSRSRAVVLGTTRAERISKIPPPMSQLNGAENSLSRGFLEKLGNCSFRSRKVRLSKLALESRALTCYRNGVCVQSK